MASALKDLTLDELKDIVSDLIQTSIKDLVQGAEVDVKTYAADISKDLILAALENRKDLVENLIGQLGLLAQINSLRVVDKFNDFMEKSLSIIFGLLSQLIDKVVIAV